MNLSGGTVINFSTAWNNTGTLSFNNAIFNNNSISNHNTGSVISGTGGFNNNSTLNLNIAQVFPSTLVYSQNGTAQGPGNLTINNDFTMQGTIQGAGSLTINGNTIWNSGIIGRALTIGAGNTLTLATTSSKFISAPITINGTMDWQDGGIFFNATTTLTNNGTITINGNNTISSNIGTGTLQNNGTITKTSTGTTTFTLSAVNNNASGVIKGVGIFSMNNTTFNNNGVIAPGLSPGLLTINNNQPLSANSTLQIEMQDGSGPGTGHDQLLRNSSITLAGTLTVTETGTVPNGTYTIISLTSGTVSGSFATTNLPSGYTLQINPTNVQLVKLTTLPLRFISFNAVMDAANNVKLTWVTENEINTSHFDVERSTDGIRYEKIGVVTAANTGGTHTYTYTDALVKKGINYYRLRQTDRDGRFEYSTIRTIKNHTHDIILLPNPVVDNLQLRGVGMGTPIHVYDASGKQLLSQTWNGTPLELSKLPTGMYTLHILIDENIVVKKFLKN